MKELKHAKDLNEYYEEKYNTISTNNNKSVKQYKLVIYKNLKEEYDTLLLLHNNEDDNSISSILTNNDFDMITSLFNVSSLHYELLYRASRDGLEQEMFHNKCDDVSTK